MIGPFVRNVCAKVRVIAVHRSHFPDGGGAADPDAPPKRHLDVQRKAAWSASRTVVH